MPEPGEPTTVPMVGIVVVNHFGGDMTLRCLEALEQLTWPADRLAIALVDNGSEPGFTDDLAARWPSTRVVTTGSNLGYGGACNRGFAVLRDCAYVALLNNDAIPEPDWLEPLVASITGGARRGAVTPKVLLKDRFLRVAISSAATSPGGGDNRSLGVQLCGARVGDTDVSDAIQLVSGFWGWEHDETTVKGAFAWTSGDAVALLPVPTGASPEDVVSLRLACGRGATAACLTMAEEQATVGVDVQPGWVVAGSARTATSVVNNAGIVLSPDGSASDRGYFAPDDGRYDRAEEVFGWSGAAVLLSRRFLDDVGPFTDRLFLYYEDVELSWRGRLRGWTYWYEPASRVRHEHSASVGERTPMARHLSERNRLLTLTRCAPTPLVVAAIRDLVRRLLASLWRDVGLRLGGRRRPVMAHAIVLLRVLGGYLRLLAPTVADRRRDGARRAVRSAVVTRWIG